MIRRHVMEKTKNGNGNISHLSAGDVCWFEHSEERERETVRSETHKRGEKRSGHLTDASSGCPPEKKEKPQSCERTTRRDVNELGAAVLTQFTGLKIRR